MTAEISTTTGTPATVALIQAVFSRPASSMVMARPLETQSARPVTTPPVASVATKDGTRSLTWTMPLSDAEGEARTGSPPERRQARAKAATAPG